MQEFDYKKLFIGIGIFVLVTMATLWSYNTLADLFGLPYAGFRHLVAFLFFVGFLKWVISTKYHHMGRYFGKRHFAHREDAHHQQA